MRHSEEEERVLSYDELDDAFARVRANDAINYLWEYIQLINKMEDFLDWWDEKHNG